jgi:very-short-patch-repair endonuclease
MRRTRYKRGLLDGVVRNRARDLRSTQTSAEKQLWSRLRRKSLDGIRFRRQHPLYGFIVDFCCLEHRLVIELDGDSHADKSGYDAWRTEKLVERGYRVVRFLNDEVKENLDAVVETIWAELKR